MPIRHGWMIVSPFTFYRGSAAIMAGDLSRTATTGLRVQCCGDAHLSNFGVWYTRFDAEKVIAELAATIDKASMKAARKALAKAHTHERAWARCRSSPSR